jgi:hypothetical protein
VTKQHKTNNLASLIDAIPSPYLAPLKKKIFKRKTKGVSYYGLAIYIKKYLKAKEEEL